MRPLAETGERPGFKNKAIRFLTDYSLEAVDNARRIVGGVPPGSSITDEDRDLHITTIISEQSNQKPNKPHHDDELITDRLVSHTMEIFELSELEINKKLIDQELENLYLWGLACPLPEKK